MAINRMVPVTPDPYVNRAKGDVELAKFAHLNELIRRINSSLLNLTPNSITFSCVPSVTGEWIIGSDWVTFTKVDYATDVDVIIPGVLEITRGNNRGIYNAAVESSYDRDDNTSPANTEWNSQETDPTNYGWLDVNNITTRIYDNWADASDYWPTGNVENQVEFVMRETTSGRYWQVQFLQWTENAAGGGFSYQRREIIFIPPVCGGITFGDGTTITSVNQVFPPDDLYEVVGSSTVFTDGSDLGNLPSSFIGWQIRVFRNGTLLERQIVGSSDPYYEYDPETAEIILSVDAVTDEKFTIMAYKKI